MPCKPYPMQRHFGTIRYCLLGRRIATTARVFRRRFTEIDFRTRQNPAYRLSRIQKDFTVSVKSFCIFFKTKIKQSKKVQQYVIMHKFRGRPLLQGVPSSKTVHWTVFEFTPCGAPLRQGISPSAEGDKGSAP